MTATWRCLSTSLCFSGEPKVFAVYSSRDAGRYEDVFDLGWNDTDHVGTYPKSERSVAGPACFKEMLLLAKALNSDFYHVRVGLFVCGDRLVFDELTFTPPFGFAWFRAVETDNVMGGRFRLPYDEVA